MNSRLILPLYAAGALAFAGVPTPVKLLWPQIGIVPPGTNDVRRTDVVGGGAVVAVPTGTMAITPAGPAGAVAPGSPGAPGLPPGMVPGRVGAGGAGATPTGAPQSGGAASAPTPTNSAAALDPPVCQAKAEQGEYPVSAFGGVVEIRVDLKPVGCTPALGASGNWILLAAGLQTPGVYRFSVSPNLATAERSGVVVVGGQRILIRQSANSGARFAATPGHIALSIKGEKTPSPRILTIFSEDKSLRYTAVPSQPWLKVAPAKNSAPGSQRLQITVDPARLRRGRNEGSLSITASGQLSAPLLVPVVVEVPRVR